MSDMTDLRRINYGCGYDKRSGYLNVDSDPACDPDVLIVDNDLSVLPRAAFDEMLALDVLEHIPRLETLSVLLEWADLLVDGGRLTLKTSSIEGVAAQLKRNPSFRDQYGWTLCLFGNQAHPGDFHLTGFTDMTLTVYLLAAGFDVERRWLTDGWLLHAEAVKRRDWSRLARESGELSDDEFVERMYHEALLRPVDEAGRERFGTALQSGRLDRRGALKEVTASPERLFTTAQQHGFEPGPRRWSPRAVYRYVPDFLRPSARAAASTMRSTRRRAQRLIGRAGAHSLRP